MSDLTFLGQSDSPTTSSVSPTPKKSKVSTILVIILVLALLGEATYFFYNRYISQGGSLPFMNLSTDKTMNYENVEETPVPVENKPETVGAVVSHVSDLSKEKAMETIDAMFIYPRGYVYVGEIKMSIQGKLVAVDADVLQVGDATYTKRLRLVNVYGEPLSLRFTEVELEKMRVVVVNKGEIEKEATFDDLVAGNQLNIHLLTDLTDLRRGADDITIEIRKD